VNKKRPDIEKLKRIACQIRKDILISLQEAGSGHTGGSLSIVELLIGLYFYKMRHDPKKPGWPDRDRFILSKGHGCPALYAVLANLGYFPKKELLTLRKIGSRLQGHPQRNVSMGIEASTGSLGQGLSIACGLALAMRLDSKDSKIYCLMGDGEIQEGQIWEAAMASSFHKLDNVCGIVDWNKLQIDGWVKDVMSLEPLKDKWKSFGWKVIEIDGHNFNEIMDAYDEADKTKEKPTVVLAHTIKGKGVSFMECEKDWHGIAPKKEEAEQALEEIRKLEEKYKSKNE
jgi:transketolase